MNVAHLFKLVLKAKEKTEREDIFKIYVSIYPHFDEKTKLTFNEFLEKFIPEKQFTTEKTDEEIMNELLNRKE